VNTREMVMYIAGRLRELREYKHLSQGDIEKRTGLLRCYISRVENGHTVPALETLEKFARALEVPLYQLFYEIEESLPTKQRLSVREKDWASQGKGLRIFTKVCSALSRMSERDRQVLLAVAAQFRNANRTRKS
jgi:transcriptional regulator with XRE-family HTH domain